MKRKHYKLLSNFAFNFNLRHYTLVLMILIGFSYGTRDINPYLNKVRPGSFGVNATDRGG